MHCEDNWSANLIVISIMIVSNQWYWQVSQSDLRLPLLFVNLLFSVNSKIISSVALDFLSISKSTAGKIVSDVDTLLRAYQLCQR